MGCVYRALCRPTGKSYVGKTTKDLAERRHSHRRNVARGRRAKFYSAIRKHGWDSFVWTVLAETTDEAELNRLEMRWIKKLDSCENGYNMTLGGEGKTGTTHTKSECRRISDRLKGNQYARGYKFTDEQRAKLSKALKGKPRPWQIGRSHTVSDETRKKLSELAKARWAKWKADGDPSKTTHSDERRRQQAEKIRGRKHTEEARRRMSEAMVKAHRRRRLAAASQSNAEQ